VNQEFAPESRPEMPNMVRESKGKPFDMSPVILRKSKNFKAAIVLIAASLPLAACGESEEKTAFVGQCEESLGKDRTKICGCVYDGLKEEKFSKEQINRVAELFRMDVRQTKKFLADSPFDYDADMLKRINTIEGITEGCAKKYK
jgi:hypothetical protein